MVLAGNSCLRSERQVHVSGVWPEGARVGATHCGACWFPLRPASICDATEKKNYEDGREHKICNNYG